MRRGFALLVLLFSIVWQPLTLAGQLVGFAGTETALHAALHWQDHGHHHHDDGSFHVDGSDESRTHVQLDGAATAPALISSPTVCCVAVGAAELIPHEEAKPPSTPPESPRRPPRHLA